MLSLNFQTKDSNKHTYGQPWSPNDGDSNQQDNQLWACSFYNMLIYWLAILFIGITFFYRWQVFLRWIKVINKTTTLVARFLCNTIYIDYRTAFFLVTSIFH